MSGTKPHPLRNPEVCVNLWAYADESGYIARVAARAYVLDGNDDAKLRVLHLLAATDFLHADWMGVSTQFVIDGADGKKDVRRRPCLDGERWQDDRWPVRPTVEKARG